MTIRANHVAYGCALALVALVFYALAPLGGVIGQLVSSHRKTD